jgi:hypothetical protein
MLVLSLDLGMAQDYTALTVLDYIKDKIGIFPNLTDDIYMRLMKLHRYPLLTDYTTIVDDLCKFVTSEPFRLYGGKHRPYQLLMDNTGVGRGVVEMGRNRGLRVIPVTITAGASERYDLETGSYNVGKAQLATTLKIETEPGGMLRVPNGIEGWETLRNEFLNFNKDVTPKGNDIFEARSGAHDDEILSLAIGVWWCKYHAVPGDPEHIKPKPSPLSQLKGIL